MKRNSGVLNKGNFFMELFSSGHRILNTFNYDDKSILRCTSFDQD